MLILAKKPKAAFNPNLIDKNTTGDTRMFAQGGVNAELTPSEFAGLIDKGIVSSCQLVSDRQNGPTEPQRSFSPGENPSLVPDSPVAERAVEDAREVVALLGGASEQVIRAGEIVFHAISIYGADRAAFKRFVAVLVTANILTKRDGELLQRSPKLKKLAAIGESAQFLRRPEICDRVRGFSCLYQLHVLFKELPGDEDCRVKALLAILASGEAKGELSREYLEQETRRAKSQRRAPKSNIPSFAPASDKVIKPAPASVGLVLMTPTVLDLKRIKDTFIDERNIGLCGRVHERCADAAIAVVEAPLHALPAITTHLLAGFDNPRIYLAANPAEPDVTEATVIIVATHGKGLRSR